MCGQRHAPAALPPGKGTRYPLCRRLGGSQDRSGQVRNISLPPGFDPRTVQPAASRYTDWAIPAHLLLRRTVFTVSFLEVKNTHTIFGEADDGVEVAHDEDVYYWCLVAEERHQGQPGDHGVPQSDDTVTAASNEQVQRPLQVETANTLAHTDISRSVDVHQTANTLPYTDISRSAGVHQTENTLPHTDISRSAGVHQTANTLTHTDISLSAGMHQTENISRSTGVHQKPVSL